MSDSTQDKRIADATRKFVADITLMLEIGGETTPPRKESPSGTIVQANSPNAAIVDSSLRVWTILTDGRVGVDGQPDTRTRGVVALLYLTGRVHQQNDAHRWWVMTGGEWVEEPDPTIQPPPNTGKGKWETVNVSGTVIHVLMPTATPRRLLLCLHQIGNESQMPDQWDQWINTPTWRATYPDVVVVVPRCPSGSEQRNWGGVRNEADTSDMDHAITLVDTLTKQHNLADLYITGNSMGGIGCWNQVCRNSGKWSAALILAGATYNNAPSTALAGLTKCAVMSIHGVLDTQVPLTFDRDVFTASRGSPVAGRFVYNEPAGMGHDVWDSFYPKPEVWTWLFNNKRTTGGGTVDPSPIDGPGRPLPSGPISVRGNQTVDNTGQPVRIAAVGTQRWEPLPADMKLIRSLGFNTIRVSWVNATYASQLNVLDTIFEAAHRENIRVILDNHTNEPGHGPQDNWGAQQKNGLWYDVGGASDGTDGGGNTGTVTHAKFVNDWTTIAARYRDAPAVLGYDLRNEPLGYGGMCSWGDGNRDHDIRLMYEEVGNKIHNVDPRALIICEGVQRYDQQCYWGDLRGVRQHPVRLVQTDKVVYSVHDYPNYVGGSGMVATGQPSIVLRNNCYGYLVKENIAPVWVGEMGANFTGTYGGENVAQSTAWAQTLLDYMNGKAQDGPRFTGDQQPMPGCWWVWGDRGNDQLNGVLKGREPRPEQQKWWSQLLFRR